MSIPWAVVALRRGAWVWAAWGKFLAAGGVATVVFAVAYWVAWRIAVPWLLALLAGWSRFQLGRDAYGWIQQLGAFGIAVGCAGFAAKTVLIRMRQQARTAVSGGGFEAVDRGIAYRRKVVVGLRPRQLPRDATWFTGPKASTSKPASTGNTP